MNNYNESINKPTINGKELIGDVSIKELPNVTSDDNGKILSVVNGEWEKTEPSGITYSLTEQKTGEKWIDGRDIYTRVIDVIPNLVDGEFIIINENITLINFYGGGMEVTEYVEYFFDMREHAGFVKEDGVLKFDISGSDFEHNPDGLYIIIFYVKNTNNNG